MPASPRLLPVDVLAGAPIPIPPTGSLVVGREHSCDIPLSAEDVSRRHAVLEGEDGDWRVRDLESANGTWVNGRRVSERRLKPGDEIRFGRVARYRYVTDADVSALRGLFLSCLRHELVAREDGFSPGRFGIGPAPGMVGRGEKADLRLDLTQVSDIHARLVTRGGRPWVSGQRGGNGTWVNGDRVVEKLLRPGDEVAFADRPFDVRLGRTPSARGLAAGAGIAVVAAVLLVGAAFLGRGPSEGESLWTRAMYEEQAERSLEEAVDAYDRDPPAVEVARARFDITVRSLIAADRLRPDVQTPDELRVAFAGATGRAADRLGGRHPHDLYSSLASMGAERDEPPPDPESLVERELSRILAEFGIDTEEQPIPPDLLAEVEHYVEFWTNKMRGYTERSIRRGAPHMELIRGELRRNHLPEVFSHLPFIESGYRLEATSPESA